MGSFLAFAGAAVRQQIGYRAEIFSMILGATIEVFARISIWKAVYGGQSAVAGITLPQMIAYAIIGATLLSNWDAALVVREIGAAIRSGQIGNTLVRPASFPLMLFAESLGPRLFNFTVVCTPVIVVFSLLYARAVVVPCFSLIAESRDWPVPERSIVTRQGDALPGKHCWRVNSFRIFKMPACICARHPRRAPWKRRSHRRQ